MLSKEGSSFIRLDKKARLVLPLLLRERLGIAKGGPNEKVVGLKVVSVADGKATVRLSGCSEGACGTAILKLSGSAAGANCIPFSKNGSEVKS